MNKTPGISGERSDHKLAAVFESGDSAQAAKRALVDEAGLEEDQLEVLAPGSADAERRLLPESRGIWRTLLRSHIWLGLAGALAAVVLFFVLGALDVPFVVDNPMAALGLFVLVLTLAGLMLGGLVTLRPDQVPYIEVAREALRSGHHVVVVHARTTDQLGEARDLLERPASKTMRTA